MLDITGKGMLYLDAEGEYAATTGSRGFFLPILESAYSASNRYDRYIYGLIVAPARSYKEGHFIRLGVFEVTFGGRSYSQLMKVLASDNCIALIPESIYQEVLEPDKKGIPQYAITLI
ncbi:hypothetical protein EG329_011362 [Mollisiaceae sp. DMI_Dod_QoI]|nr:hypothetical protein EG329_011362 [Helotiales sp. DMI_Dod_QoI]